MPLKLKKDWIPYFAVLIFAMLALKVDYNASKWKNTSALEYDRYGYHNYLPAIFIYTDITKYKFLDSIESRYGLTHGGVKKYGLHPTSKDSNLCNQYPMGVAIFQAPLFLVAHAWALYTQQNSADGYSSPYQHAAVMSTLLFGILALIILVRFLKNFISPWSIFLTILLISLGTNFWQYVTLESAYSHIYLFFLYAAMLYLSVLWYRRATFLNSVLIGIVIGLATITRPTDILIFLLPTLWINKSSEIAKSDYLKLNWKYILLAIVAALVTCMPQLIYWKHVSGKWIYYSYSSIDYFEFNRFRVLHGLISYKKGWFVYTPLALIGIWQLIRHINNLKLAFYSRMGVVFFAFTFYIVFSWHNWFYGWSFGCRALIGALPLLALPIGVLMDEIRAKAIKNKVLYTLGFLFVIYLNLFQTWQYNQNILHGTLMNETAYWKIFFKTEAPEKLEKVYKLQADQDYLLGY